MKQKKGTAPRCVIEGLPSNNDRLVAWWYCALKKNPTAPSEPTVEVCFRSVLKDGSFINYFYYEVGLTNLGQVRLGSIWQNQRKIGQIQMHSETFQLDFNDDGWNFASPWDQPESGNEPGWLVPPHAHRLRDLSRHPKTRVVAFHLTGKPKGLIIPCLEIFSRMYGRSQYLKRVLATQPFDAALDSLIVPDVQQAPVGAWQVTVEKHCVDSDAVFLAHLKYDEATRKRVRSVWAQCEGGQNTGGYVQSYPKIGPWFTGAAQLKVSGLWLDDQRQRFLALQVNGLSNPGGAEIYLDRENTNLTGPLTKIKGGVSWPRVRVIRPDDGPEIVVTHTQEPGAGHAIEEVLDDEITILGAQRKVVRLKRDTTAKREKPTPSDQQHPTKVSGGAPYGGLKNVAPATIVAPEGAKIDGHLMRIWKTLQRMQKETATKISTFAAVTGDCKLDFTAPVIISFPDPMDSRSALNDRAKPWVYLDHTQRAQLRGVMLLQIETSLGTGYIMEIQRRPKQTVTEKLQSSGAHQGLAFRLDANQMTLKEWVPMLLRQTANEVGVVSRVVKHCPGSCKTFNHQSELKGGLRTSILNGLKGIGLI